MTALGSGKRTDPGMKRILAAAVAAFVVTTFAAMSSARADAGWARGMRAMFALGIDRLMVGPGLLLLWLVLLTAPLVAMHGHWSGVRTSRGAVRAVAASALAFVLGHALSLALGTLAVVGGGRLPAAAIEVLVALSLALVAFHTVRPLGRVSGGCISAAGGVVHGLAFAGTLADVGPFTSTGSMVMFVVGVEGLQILLVGLVAPSLIFLREHRVYGVLRAGAASAAAIAALVTLAPTPLVLLGAVAGLSLSWLAVATFVRTHATRRVSA